MSDKSKKERAGLLFQLRKILVSKAEAAIADQTTLRDAVCQFVFSEQRRGASLASMIGTVRDILATAEKDASKASGVRGLPAASAELARKLVEWCIEFQRAGGPLIPIGPGLVS
jgi:hypothetical protein